MSKLRCLDRENCSYHVYNRGVNKQIIFLDDEDRWFFINLCKRASVKFEVLILGFCLMGNHYHLYLHTKFANLSKVMKYIGEKFSKYFLGKYKELEKSGHTFMGPYGRKIVQDEVYSEKLLSYIHLNPYKDGFVEDPKDYFWSSYNSYLLGKDFFGLVNTEMLKNYFTIHRINTISKEELDWDPKVNTMYGYVLGDIDFAKTIYDNEEIKNYGESRLGRPNHLFIESEILRDSINLLKLEDSLKRKILSYCLLEWSELNAKDIGIELGSSSATIRNIKYRVKKDLEAHKGNLCEIINEIRRHATRQVGRVAINDKI